MAYKDPEKQKEYHREYKKTRYKNDEDYKKAHKRGVDDWRKKYRKKIGDFLIEYLLQILVLTVVKGTFWY